MSISPYIIVITYMCVCVCKHIYCIIKSIEKLCNSWANMLVPQKVKWDNI